MKQYIIILAVIMTGLPGLCRNITGKVVGENNTPVDFANVMILNQYLKKIIFLND